MVTSPTMVTGDRNRAVVVMVPLPLHGHINQLLHLSRLVSFHNIPVHFVCTTTHGHNADREVQGWNPNTISTIYFHHFPISIPITTSSPPNNSTNNFPSHIQPICEAAAQLRGPVSALLRKLSPTTNRLVVIHDSLMGSVIQDFVSLPNAESYTFHSVSAFSIALYTSEKVGQQVRELIEGDDINQPQLALDLSFEGCFTSEFKKFISVQHEYIELSSGRIYNTCRAVEQRIISLLETEARNENKLIWALGPYNPVKLNRSRKDKCIEWLDKQATNTVIFVSFGTTISFSREQIVEIATGLEKSGQKFMWVLRYADLVGDENIKRVKVELPEGYEDRIKDRGLVVREWAPQLEILAHPSVGGFMSHCGWNSCMESVSMGVPIAAWPIHSDQPNNAVLVTRVLKLGLPVKEWGRREELVMAPAVEKAVRKLMGSKEGEEIRKRAMEMGQRVRNSVSDGGVTQTEIKSFIGHITR